MKTYKIDGREDLIEVFTPEEEKDFLEEVKAKK